MKSGCDTRLAGEHMQIKTHAWPSKKLLDLLGIPYVTLYMGLVLCESMCKCVRVYAYVWL